MDAEMGRDGPDGPPLDLGEAEDLGLEFEGDSHRDLADSRRPREPRESRGARRRSRRAGKPGTGAKKEGDAAATMAAGRLGKGGENVEGRGRVKGELLGRRRHDR
jgi:hypothetical protein